MQLAKWLLDVVISTTGSAIWPRDGSFHGRRAAETDWELLLKV